MLTSGTSANKTLVDSSTVSRIGSAFLLRENEAPAGMRARLLSRFDAFKTEQGTAGVPELANMLHVEPDVAQSLLENFFGGAKLLTRDEFAERVELFNKDLTMRELYRSLADEENGDIHLKDGGRLTLEGFRETMSRSKLDHVSYLDARWAGTLFLSTLKRIETGVLQFDTVSHMSQRGRCGDLRYRMYLYRLEIFWMVLLTCLTIFVFLWNFFRYYLDRKNVFDVFGFCICFARGAGLAINFLMMPLIITLARSFWTWVRASGGGVATKVIPVDRVIELHKVAGLAVLFFSIVHISGQICNFKIIGESTPEELSSAFTRNITQPISTEWMWTQSVPGTTGIAMVAIFAVAYPMTMRPVRKTKHFKWFWFTHHLLIVFFFLLAAHGTSSYFQHYASVFFMVGPFALWVFDRLYRAYGSLSNSTRAKIVELTAVAPKVVKLVCEKPHGRAGLAQLKWNAYIPGGYAFVNIPNIASLEWHPFSMTSAPQDDTVSFHIQVVGSWTSALKDLSKDPPKFAFLDGPFGAPSQSYLRQNIAVFIAGGIGVTPYTSILSSFRDKQARYNLKKVILVWIVKSADDLDWMKELLLSVIKQCEGMIEIVRFVTDKSLEKRIEETEGMLTIYGKRPSLDAVFYSAMAAARQYGDECGVFFTGNEVLGNNIKHTCMRLSQNSALSGDGSEFTFTFKREVF